MGFIGKWIEKRRLKKLDIISKEIEALKSRGPHYMIEKKLKKEKPDLGVRVEGKYIKKDTNFNLLLIIGLCLIVIVVLSLFYKQRFSVLTDKYNQKLNELSALGLQLSNLTSALNETDSKLKFKERVEKDLSTQYVGLEEEKESLESQIRSLQQDIEKKVKEIDDLKKAVLDKDAILDQLEECILDDDVENKEDCL